MKSNYESEKSSKNKGTAFKAPSSQIEEEIEDDDSDEEMTIFTRRFNKMFKRGQFSKR